MRKLAVLGSAVVVASVLAASAHAALFFLIDPTAVEPGDRVTIRLGGTPEAFTAEDRQPPLQRPMRIYLVPVESAGSVRGRFDPRLYFVGSLRPDRNAHGALTFAMPALDPGTYAVAAWCPGCATFRRGRAFWIQTVPAASRYRDEMAVRLRWPAAAKRCPVTRGPYGNGLLSTSLPRPDGTLPVVRKDGTLFQKLPWTPHRGLTGRLTVRGERLDAPSPPLKVLNVFWGYSSTGKWSWASPVEFPSEGCWRISGRVNDVILTYVVRVVGP